MKKFGFSVGVLAFCAAMFLGFAGCSNSAGGNSGDNSGVGTGGTPVVNPGGTVSDNEDKILDMRIKKNGVAYVSQNLSQNIISKSITTGYDDSIFISQNECLQSEHVKIEKVSNGLKFTITRPEEDCYDSSKYEEIQRTDANGNPVYSYEYVGYGNGSYITNVERVGEGNGDYKYVYKDFGEGNGYFVLAGKCHYKEVGYPNGQYERKLKSVGDGNGNFKYKYIDVGSGHGSYKLENGVYSYVGYPYGSYESLPWYVGDGNGDFKHEYVPVSQGEYSYTEELVDEYIDVLEGNGSYNKVIVNVGEGNGDLNLVYNDVGLGNGSYEYTDKQKKYGGWGYTAIYREELIDGKVVQTTCAAVSNHYDGNQVECFYPLCEPGERYVFKVQIEPSDVNTYRAYQRYEWLAVTALGGIGDIDYSNINAERHCDLSYDGTKPIVKLVDCIAPNAKNVKTLIGFFVTDSVNGSEVDWETPNATIWFNDYNGTSENDNEIATENVVTYFGQGTFNDMLEKSGKKRFFAQYFFSFEVNEGSGISFWKTAGVDSQIVSFRQ